MYTTTDKCRSFSGEIETSQDVILTDELTCEDLPFEVVKRDLNSDMNFCSARLLTEFMNILNQDWDDSTRIAWKRTQNEQGRNDTIQRHARSKMGIRSTLEKQFRCPDEGAFTWMHQQVQHNLIKTKMRTKNEELNQVINAAIFMTAIFLITQLLNNFVLWKSYLEDTMR